MGRKRLSRPKTAPGTLAINHAPIYSEILQEADDTFRSVKKYYEENPPSHMIIRHLHAHLHPQLARAYARYRPLNLSPPARRTSAVRPRPSIVITVADEEVPRPRTDASDNNLRRTPSPKLAQPLRRAATVAAAVGVTEASGAAPSPSGPTARRQRRGSVDVGALLRGRPSDLGDLGVAGTAGGSQQLSRDDQVLTRYRKFSELPPVKALRSQEQVTSSHTSDQQRPDPFVLYHELRSSTKSHAAIAPSPIDAPWDRKVRQKIVKTVQRGSVFSDLSTPNHKHHEGLHPF